MPFQFSIITGSEGKITVPAVGAEIGTMRSWTLRREESGPNVGSFSLHAVLSYANEILLKDDGVRKQVVITLRRNKATGKEEKALLEYETLAVTGEREIALTGAKLCPVE